jgi:hypothetical protein
MSAVPRVLVAIPVVAACALGLGGCRGGDRAALPAAPAVSTPALSTPAATPAVAAGSGARAHAAAGDPLAGIESEVDAVERDVSSDAGSGSAVGPAPRR